MGEVYERSGRLVVRSSSAKVSMNRVRMPRVRATFLRRVPAWGAAILLLAACGGSGPVNTEADVCPQPRGQDWVIGCAAVHGRALDQEGRPWTAPLTVVMDSVLPVTSVRVFTSAIVTADGGGRFEFRVTGYDPNAALGRPGTTRWLDTATVALRAFASASPRPEDGPFARVPIFLRFGAPGARPVDNTVEVRLPSPGL